MPAGVWVCITGRVPNATKIIAIQELSINLKALCKLVQVVAIWLINGMSHYVDGVKVLAYEMRLSDALLECSAKSMQKIERKREILSKDESRHVSRLAVA